MQVSWRFWCSNAPCLLPEVRLTTVPDCCKVAAQLTFQLPTLHHHLTTTAESASLFGLHSTDNSQTIVARAGS